jgi:hypothetical protein
MCGNCSKKRKKTKGEKRKKVIKKKTHQGAAVSFINI